MFKKGNQKGECSKNKRIKTKMLFLKKKNGEKGHTCKKQINLQKMPDKKVHRQKNCRRPKCLKKRGHRQKNKRKKRKTIVLETRKKKKKRDNIWTNGWTQGGHEEVTHACKKSNAKSFFDTKEKLLFKNLKKEKVKKLSSCWRRSRK